MSGPKKTRNIRSSLKDIIAVRKRQLEEGLIAVIDLTPSDPYERCYKYFGDSRKFTCIGTDTEIMINHKNDWDENHPESPARLLSIIDRAKCLYLLSRCELLSFPHQATINDVALVHTPDLFNKLKHISRIDSVDEREHLAANYDGIYFGKETFVAAVQALSWTLNVAKSVSEGCFHNGFAIVRPPGHHAGPDAYEGYCYFNNIAIAAEKLIKDKLCNKIMIIDFDVHHGDGTQKIFFNRKDVLYFSIHRYEHGTFWPNLRESNFDFIGGENSKGYNVNVPLNGIKLRDSDYLAIVFNLLLPIAFEYNPDLILISAGYDAAVGCPEGQMLLTPGFYAHLVSLLSGLANGKTVMVLEGGYFVPSLSESAVMSLKSLIGDPCPMLEDESLAIQRNVVDTINNCKGALYDYWRCFSVNERFELVPDEEVEDAKEHVVTVKYFGEVETPPHQTRDYYPINSQLVDNSATSIIQNFRKNEDNYRVFKGTGYGYEPSTLLHVPDSNSHSFENPDRLTKILELMDDADLTQFLTRISLPSDRNDIEHCLKVHDKCYMDQMLANSLPKRHDLYINEHTANAAMTSIGVLLTLVDSVLTDKVTNAAALIRPPGHHASIKKAQGFCFVNNTAVAAKYALEKYKLKKILIVDFDVHHGNGTQDIFYTSNEVLYISIHRFDNGAYYPSKPSAGAKFFGHGLGEGFNVNIPFSNGAMGNSEYLAAFLNVILPIGYEFRPDLVLVSAGFDAGINDPLGGYNVSPEMFGQFIYLLKPLAAGKLVVILEGGYNLHTTGYGMLMCLKALRGQAVPIPVDLFNDRINENAAQSIRNVIEIQKPFWQSLNVMKSLSNGILYCKNDKEFSEGLYTLSKYDSINVDP